MSAERLCELNCGERALDLGKLCEEHERFAAYWAGLTPEQREAEHRMVEQYVRAMEEER